MMLPTAAEPIIIEGQTIYPIDCIDAFNSIEDESIDHIVTSPPYNFGGFHSDQKKRAYLGDFNDNLDEKKYISFIKNVFNECYRVLSMNGNFFFNIKTRIENGVSIPPYWIFNNDDAPFLLKQEIIWHYPSTANVDKVRFFPLFEYIYWFVKDKTIFKFNKEWAVIGNVWYISHIKEREETKVNEKQHPAPFPTQLPQTTILATTNEGDTVLDPFLGSGTTLKVCRRYNRKGIGFEKYFNEYDEIVRNRIRSNDFPKTLLDIKREKKTRKLI